MTRRRAACFFTHPVLAARSAVAFSLASLLLAATPAASEHLPHARPDDVQMNARLLEQIPALVEEGLSEQRMPGCVVAVGRHGRLVYLEAFGNRQLKPESVAMKTDTVFDMASITKPVATATSVMILLQRGQLRLEGRVADYLPEFGQKGKESITIQQLLTHQSGLIADNALKDYEEGADQAFERIFALEPQVEPGSKFIYSDVGFIVLAELVKRVSGQDVHEFSQRNIFEPLGMHETGYLPDEKLRERAVTTEQREGRWMRGEVHDPRAYLLGGVAGHAGLFSTAEDLAVYAQMMLRGGQYGGARVLSPRTVDVMTRPYRVSSGTRGLGWDKQTGYSSNRGDLLSPRAFGHGGFTGTVLWMDPQLDLFVIFLSNRIHPDGKGSVNTLAGRIVNVAAAAVEPRGERADGEAAAAEIAREESGEQDDARRQEGLRPVLTGIDVLVRDEFRQLRGRRVGLITNHTGIDRRGRRTVELLAKASQVELVTLFSPEHGLEGKLDIAKINDTRDEATGLKVFSLYGETRKPTAESLQDIDTLVFDIQDIGARFYTYVSTMGLAMQAAAEQGKRFVVLDRPNPINGVDVAGPVLDAGQESFVGFHTLPVRHGMTVGEIARMLNEELQIDVPLEVIKMEGWRRSDYFDATGLLWIDPSPNMRNLNEALLYPGVGLLETTNVSVGRGTDTPFEHVGAPWIEPQQLAARLNQAGLAGVRFVPEHFTPESSVHAGEECGAVHVLITDRAKLEPLRVGFEIARQLRLLYPDDWQTERYLRLLADQATLDAVMAGKTVDEIEAGYADELQQFLERRKRFLMY